MVRMDIQMPEYCYDCPCHNGENGQCKLCGQFTDVKRPYDCPLIEEDEGRFCAYEDRGLMLTVNEDGTASLYDDTYDITIHCNDKQEQERAWELIKRGEDRSAEWIPISTNADPQRCKFAKCKCSNCGHEEFAASNVVEKGNYCPICGAYMR